MLTSEKFGLVSSDHISSFGGLLTIKDDGEIEDVVLDMPVNGVVSDEDIIATMGLSHATLSLPELDRKSDINPGTKQQVSSTPSTSRAALASVPSNDQNTPGSAADQAIVSIFCSSF